ncbi:uncharacterized protein [Ptychodera flava]|uniref:uncharacterized protein n=1 Tax=Ptychodera flava TaxID=63121 RepID=UPI00396A8B18
MAKARVAPLKQISIPRLELTAATVAVRLDKLLRKEMDLPIDESVFWTDSRTVLRYINNDTTRFHTFVANRIAVIRGGSDPANWRYLNTSENPADECSRGQKIDVFLKNERWRSGPDFLLKTQDKWPSDSYSTQLDPEDAEVKKSALVHRVSVRSEEETVPVVFGTVPVVSEERQTSGKVTVSTTSVNAEETVQKLIHYYSSWYKLKKAVAWIRKVGDTLLRRAKNKSCSVDGPHEITVEDMKAAETAIIKFVQKKAFPKDIESLSADRYTDKKSRRNSNIYRLDPVIGADGLLRVGGRLSLSMVAEEAKHPVILPKRSHVAELLLREIHERGQHFGRAYILSKLRERYWIPGANSAARSIVSKCVTCRRQRARLCEQKMADLPADRLQSNEPPFTNVGIDYFGPIEVKIRRSTVKRYGVIFTCLAIRAVHIEVAESLSTDSFINALRRFISRRGPVKSIRSDNGTNFVGANRVLKEELEKWNEAKIKENLLREGIEWKFNPPYGSHFGGVWERQIRTIRQLLNVIVGNNNLQMIVFILSCVKWSTPLIAARLQYCRTTLETWKH